MPKELQKIRDDYLSECFTNEKAYKDGFNACFEAMSKTHHDIAECAYMDAGKDEQYDENHVELSQVEKLVDWIEKNVK